MFPQPPHPPIILSIARKTDKTFNACHSSSLTFFNIIKKFKLDEDYKSFVHILAPPETTPPTHYCVILFTIIVILFIVITHFNTNSIVIIIVIIIIIIHNLIYKAPFAIDYRCD